MKKSVQNRPISGQLIAGAVVVLVGVLLLLDQLDIADTGNIFQFFPLIFIGIAVWQIVQNGIKHATGPLITIAVFGFIQLAILDVIDGSIIGRLWPLILIFIGASILLRQRDGASNTTGTLIERSNSSDTFDVFAMFGGGDRQITTQSFAGGNATVMFGGAEIDLRQMQVEDKPAIINVFAMFGGVAIKASDDMLIKNNTFALFGGTGDERKQRKMLSGEKPDIVVKGTVLFGGISIEN